MAFDITDELVEQIAAIAKRAGKAILEVYRSDFSVEIKADSSPVTEADHRAEEIIERAIADEVRARFPIVSEEAFARGHAPDVSGGPFWLVDPLDGTKQFVNRLDEFTVNIALIEDARPVLGVIHAPAIDATYRGSRNGVFAQTDDDKPRPIRCRPAPADGLVAALSRSHLTPETKAYLKGLRIAKEITSGSSLKFCLIAAGEADIYPRMGRTMEWDTAAGHAIVRFAGGSVKDLEGHELRYGKAGFENPSFIARGAEPPGDGG